MNEAKLMKAPKEIWLQPWCVKCEGSVSYGEGRLWCEDDVWDRCDQCREKSVRYVLAEEEKQ